jgi:hypothetical protein
MQAPDEVAGDHNRGYVCVYPAWFYGNYAACTTHLSTAHNNVYRDQQAAYFRDNVWALYAYFGFKGVLGADLNGTRGGSSAINSLAGYVNTVDAGPSGVPTCCSPDGTPSQYVNRFDYVLLIDGWAYQTPAVVAIPFGQCASTDHFCTEPPGFLVSDHKTVGTHYG